MYACGLGPFEEPTAIGDGRTGPDGRPYFTKPGSENGFRPYARLPGRPLAIDSFTDSDMLMEGPGVYPNVIALDARRRPYWTESAAHRPGLLGDGQDFTFGQLASMKAGRPTEAFRRQADHKLRAINPNSDSEVTGR
jgi:hypothetical protein